MTFLELYSSIYADLTAPAPGLKAYYSEQLPLDDQGNLVPPNDPAYIVISLATDEAVTDFDNEAYGTVTVRLGAWATDAEAALNILQTALDTLTPKWERGVTSLLGRDTGYVGYVATIRQER